MASGLSRCDSEIFRKVMNPASSLFQLDAVSFPVVERGNVGAWRCMRW